MSEEQNEETTETGFAAFEASANEPDPVEEKDEQTEEQSAEVNDKDDTLALGDKDTPELKESETRSRHPSQRIAHYRALAGEAERARDAAVEELAALKGGASPEKAVAPDPNDEKYDFGEADPKYLKDLARHEARQIIAEERAEERKRSSEQAANAEIVGKLHDGMASIEKAGPEKYEDFEDKIAAAVESRSGEPLPPLLSIGIAVSPAGADIAYRLATDDKTSERIEKLAATNPQMAAIAFGELEGEFLSDDSDSDLNPADPLDLARMLGREKARRKSGVRTASDIDRKVTRAPVPAEQRARGQSGQFEVRGDTTDFAAFERKANAKR
jgi:hypothetical protein